MDGRGAKLLLVASVLAVMLTLLAFSPSADASDAATGDLNGDGVVDEKDSIYMLYHTFLPEKYPLDQRADYDGDGIISSDDAITLYEHIQDSSGELDPGKGVILDPADSTLSYDQETQWTITDKLAQFAHPNVWTEVSDKISLGPGYYDVAVGDDITTILIDGEVEKSVTWDYWYEGTTYQLHADYSIDVSDLVDVTLENHEWNESAEHVFLQLPKIVSVNDTVKDIESQIHEQYIEIVGYEDEQTYAGFLVSFAQMTIKYPTLMGPKKTSLFDEPKKSSDYEVWGLTEYWADTLETLYHGKGDCEDSSAVACALFEAAGMDAAMVGLSGHVAAGLALDDFKETDMNDFRQYNKAYSAYTVASAKAVTGGDATYYAVETTKKQVPIGYLMKGSANGIGNSTLHWGISGFYPVE